MRALIEWAKHIDPIPEGIDHLEKALVMCDALTSRVNQRRIKWIESISTKEEQENITTTALCMWETVVLYEFDKHSELSPAAHVRFEHFQNEQGIAETRAAMTKLAQWCEADWHAFGATFDFGAPFDIHFVPIWLNHCDITGHYMNAPPVSQLPALMDEWVSFGESWDTVY